jgi:hypothetical protein
VLTEPSSTYTPHLFRLGPHQQFTRCSPDSPPCMNAQPRYRRRRRSCINRFGAGYRYWAQVMAAQVGHGTAHTLLTTAAMPKARCVNTANSRPRSCSFIETARSHTRRTGADVCREALRLGLVDELVTRSELLAAAEKVRLVEGGRVQRDTSALLGAGLLLLFNSGQMGRLHEEQPCTLPPLLRAC